MVVLLAQMGKEEARRALLRQLGGKVGDYPECEKATGEVLALPIFGELSEEQLAYVVQNIKDFASK